ncbi:hypothetical protein [Streptomyces venezuelae]|uniref:hypothetical protein n=1 Tax=Streptomyces venezuelae TaxID=54571 RepID=UPI003647EDF4
MKEIGELLTVRDTGACAEVKADLRPRIAARLKEAERRTAELDAFTTSLRHAITHLEALPRPADPLRSGVRLPLHANTATPLRSPAPGTGDGTVEVDPCRLLVGRAEHDRTHRRLARGLERRRPNHAPRRPTSDPAGSPHGNRRKTRCRRTELLRLLRLPPPPERPPTPPGSTRPPPPAPPCSPPSSAPPRRRGDQASVRRSSPGTVRIQVRNFQQAMGGTISMARR